MIPTFYESGNDDELDNNDNKVYLLLRKWV